MQVPIVQGIYTSNVGDFRVAYPVNMVPVPVANGISAGYLKPADGIVEYGSGPGVDRGGINWNDACYRVMGKKLLRVESDGTYTLLADIPGSGQVTFDYSFDRLAIAADGVLYYWTGSTLQIVTDVDMGTVLDVIWVDGYFMTTDGQYLVVTELTDPLAVNPLKYGSSEADPDPIKAILKLRNEPHALNRYTIEAFDNVGGEFFPFQRIEGAQIQKGTVGTHACCLFADAIAFVGGGRNEAVSVYVGANGQAQRIATREIDLVLADLPDAQLSDILTEARTENGHMMLYIHLPDRTLVYDLNASKELGQPAWHILSSAVSGFEQYRARNLVYCYGKWIVGDPTSAKYGCLTDTLSTHYGDMTGWEVNTPIIYNEGRGAVVHELELVSLTGRLNGDPIVWTSYSTDGETWSMEKSRPAGKYGERTRRIAWLQQGILRQWRIQRFRGTSEAHISITRLEAQIEALYA
jgi:hypothetical protein